MKRFLISSAIAVVLIIATFISYNIYTTNAIYIKEEKSKEKIDITKEEYKPLLDILKSNYELRNATYNSNELDNDTMLKYILRNIPQKDVKTKIIQPIKIICYASYGISFTSSDSCKIKMINNDKIMEYQKKFFGTEKKLEYKEINYNGMNCKNNGKTYFCMGNVTTQPIKTYSFYDESYKLKDDIVLHEYYLKINPKDERECKRFFTEEYCLDQTKVDPPTIEEKTIKKYGVYYKHTFSKIDETYYLKSSEVVTN